MRTRRCGTKKRKWSWRRRWQESNSYLEELFRFTDITDAFQACNFNKGLGPDCFDGNVLQANETLGDKIAYEIVYALNSKAIPTYLQVGRMVPL